MNALNLLLHKKKPCPLKGGAFLINSSNSKRTVSFMKAI